MERANVVTFGGNPLTLVGITRGVVVIDKEGIVRHVEYVKEVKSHPEYDKVLEVVKSLL